MLNATANDMMGKYTQRALFLRSLRHCAHTDCFFSLSLSLRITSDHSFVTVVAAASVLMCVIFSSQCAVI